MLALAVHSRLRASGAVWPAVRAVLMLAGAPCCLSAGGFQDGTWPGPASILMIAAAVTLSVGWSWRLRRLRRQLAQAQAEAAHLRKELDRNTDLASRLLANVSHEIRTPMNGILGMTELTLTEELTPEHRANLQLVRSSTHALLSVLNNVVDLSHAQSGRLQLEVCCFSLRDQVQEAVSVIRDRAAERGLLFRSEVNPALPDQLEGDPFRIRQVLLGLLNNAIKFTQSGEIRLDVNGKKSGGSLELQFSIHDTGIGMSPEQLALALPSDAAQKSRPPSGLGLAVARQLVTLMGGRLWAESKPGAGSTFHFTATVSVAPDVPGDRSVRGATPKPLARPLRVLVAEDNPLNQKVISSILLKRGHYMTVAMDGCSAVTMYEHGEFDVVLMDVHMPGMDGLAATRAIREKEARRGGPRIRIVALTADALDGDKERCIEAGMDGYMAKPIDLETMLRALEQPVEPAPAPASPGKN